MKKGLLFLMVLLMCALGFTPVFAQEDYAQEIAGLYKNADVKLAMDDANAVHVAFSDTQMTADKAGIALNDGIATISAAGTYVLSGDFAGQVQVNVGKEDKVYILLNGVSIDAPIGPALYVVSADKVIITLNEGTQNALSDNVELVVSEEENDVIVSALYSKDDLSINGSGALKVTGRVSNGIVCKDDLVIAGGLISVAAVNDGIRGKDSLTVLEGTLDVVAGGDALSSTGTDEGKGNVNIAGGVINCVTGGGAENASQRSNNWYYDDATEDDAASQKGVKAAATLTVYAGTLNLNTVDDALHANNVSILGGEMNIATGDDGVHADSNVTIKDGEIIITNSYEGIEGGNIYISGGYISLVASDDGINAAGGTDGSGLGSRGGRMDRFAVGDYIIDISGGTVHVNADGDGIDSNGNVTFSGGYVYISGPTNSGNGALDYSGTCMVSGGTLMALGASGMAQGVSSVENQASIFVTLNGQAGIVTLEDGNGNELLSFTQGKSFSSCVLTSPDIQVGGTYSILLNGQVLTTVTVTESMYGDGSSGGWGFGGGKRDNRRNMRDEGTQTVPRGGIEGTPPELPQGEMSPPQGI